MDTLVRVVKDCGFSVQDAVTMACRTPAAILNVKKGVIKESYDADIIVFDDDINVSDVFVMGKKLI
jgi:N-acetylglucosamine-6-phosphate deacetylase